MDRVQRHRHIAAILPKGRISQPAYITGHRVELVLVDVVFHPGVTFLVSLLHIQVEIFIAVFTRLPFAADLELLHLVRLVQIIVVALERLVSLEYAGSFEIHFGELRPFLTASERLFRRFGSFLIIASGRFFW